MTDIFQSPGDRLRFEILLKSLTEGSINLAVLSEHDMVLDYYGNLFEERLRAKGNHHVEFCFSTNSERLVQKFNEILSELTLNEALDKDKNDAPRRFLIFRDSVLMQDFELQLLARLVNGFPAGNINVILLINSAADFRTKIAAFGKNLLEWEVETQAGEPKKPLTDWVADSADAQAPQIEPTLTPFPTALAPPSADALELLKPPAKTSWRVPVFGKSVDAAPAAAETLPGAPMPEVSREPVLQASAALTAPKVAETQGLTPPRKSIWGWLLLAFLLSVAAFGAMYQDLVMQEVDAFKKYLLRGTPAAVSSEKDAAVAAAAAAAASAAASAQVQAASSAAASAAVEVASQVASAPDLAASMPALTPASAVLPDVDTPKVVDKPKPKPVEKVPAKVADVPADDAWLDKLPPNGFVVQLAAFDTQAEALAFQRSNAVYANARIVGAPKKGSAQRYFIVLSRPMADKAQADAFMQSSPLLAKGWLRSVKSLKAQFNKP